MSQALKNATQYGKYHLFDRVNVGGMAEVFRAKAFGVEGFERMVAVKRILPAIAADKEFIEMFVDEAKIAVQLNHANIAQIFDLGKVEDSFFIALEFIHGKDLRSIFDRCKAQMMEGSPSMPIAQACFIVMKCCEGLDYAHNKRDPQGDELHIVHRDVSPQNMLISYDGEVKLIDFGIAKAAGRASSTQQGILKGKFGYMSPEQVRGLPLDRRSDVFALGIVLYEMLTGERLFIGESDFSTLEKVRNVEILPPSTYNRKITDELERIVMKALAKDVEDRYQSAIDLHDDLQAFMYSAGEFYSRKDLAAWMKRVFAAEIAEESTRMEQYRQMPAPEPTGAKTERPRRQTKQGIGGEPPSPGSAREVSADDMSWDDEELATNIYDTPADAADAVVEDHADDLTHVELAEDGAPVPAPPRAAPQEIRAATPSGTPPRALDPARQTATVSPLPPVAAARPPGKKGASKAIFAVSLVVVLCAAAVAISVVRARRPGEIVITSEPATGVHIFVDKQRQANDGTPATLTLRAGSYVVTLEREGYVPWTEQIDVAAGETVRRQVPLERLTGGTGFRLFSTPPGAQAILDGKALDGATPMQVASVTAGRHRIEVKSDKGSWVQDVELEDGKIIDITADLLGGANKPSTSPAASPEPSESPPPSASPAPSDKPRVAVKPPRDPDVRPTPPEPPDEPVRPKRPTEPTPQAGGSEGYLRLGSKPWTNIIIDGKDTGLHTPQTHLKLSAGSHKITLTNPQFNVKESFTVEVKAGETETVIKDYRQDTDDE